MSRYGRGLAVKMNGFRGAAGAVGFVLSKAEMKKLDDLKDAMLTTSKTVGRAGNLLSVGLGAVSVGLVVNALARERRR